jgi:hypothetical protein
MTKLPAKPPKPYTPRRKAHDCSPGADVYWRALARFEAYSAWRALTKDQAPHPSSLVDFIIDAIDETLSSGKDERS